MRENEKKTKAASTLGITAERTATDKAGDSGSSKLRQAANAVGNEELQRRIQKGGGSRDELFQFIAERLRTMRTVQNREISETPMEKQREWWKEVSDSHKDGMKKPDPTRWAEPAKIYEEAAYQLGRGALGRGGQLVERAIEAEKKVIDSTTELVQVDDLDTEVDAPDVMGAITTDAACPMADVPADIEELARKIQNVTEQAIEPPVRRRVRDPWWTLEEEEEEEEGGGEGG